MFVTVGRFAKLRPGISEQETSGLVDAYLKIAAISNYMFMVIQENVCGISGLVCVAVVRRHAIKTTLGTVAAVSPYVKNGMIIRFLRNGL